MRHRVLVGLPESVDELVPQPLFAPEAPHGSLGKTEFVWLLPLLLPVVVGGSAAIVAASIDVASSRPTGSTLLGMLALLASSAVAQALPVPIEEVRVGATSLSTIFVAGTAVLYGWAPAILVGAATMALVELAMRHAPVPVAFNVALYGLSGAAAGLIALPFARASGTSAPLVAALAATLAFYVTNIALLAAIVARSSRREYRVVVGRHVRLTALPALIMASFTVVLVALWRDSPPIAAALVGPLVAISLYQRSAFRERASMRLAHTDPLTGLGNRRAFDVRLQEELDHAAAGGTPVALCLIDVDEFKAINDAYGHVVGDTVLTELAAQLRRSGEAFRLGGDEFALILPGCDEVNGSLVAAAVVKRVIGGVYTNGLALATSTGVAAYPQRPVDREELVRLADRELYSAKHAKKTNRATDGKARGLSDR